MKVNKILVPIDFSKYSDYAADHALFLAEKYNAEVTLLHAVVLHYADAGEKEYLEAYETAYRHREEESFRRLRKTIAAVEQPALEINSKVIRGFNAADAILEFIQNNKGYDLVVMGTHGRSGFKRMLYGSVAEKVVRLSPIPVITTHRPLKKFAIEKILVPVDFSEYSARAVGAALALKKKFNSQLIFIHVIDDAIHPSFYAANLNIFDLNPGIKDHSMKRLRAFVDSEKDCSFMVVSGTPSKEIASAATALNVDLILVGTRGLTGLEHWLLGSTAERVVHMAEMPVLTVGRRKSEMNTDRKIENNITAEAAKAEQ